MPEPGGKQQILDSLGAQGVTAKDSRYADDVICLEGVDYLEGLEAFGRAGSRYRI